MDVKLKSSSHLFKKWVIQMDDILSKTHTHDQAGVPTTQDTEHFKEQRERLSSTKVDVYSAPVYPVNQWLAQDFVNDEIECRTYEQDLEKTDGRNRR
mgnify:FL=1|jgi:hypothetical protein|tara:strand:+ start:150 stop:440 length:291 start_codon:yes stop_codon:yes gene_type:complete